MHLTQKTHPVTPVSYVHIPVHVSRELARLNFVNHARGGFTYVAIYNPYNRLPRFIVASCMPLAKNNIWLF